MEKIENKGLLVLLIEQLLYRGERYNSLLHKYTNSLY